MHVAGLVDLCHGRVDQRIAGATLAPRREQLIGMRPLLPANLVVLGLETRTDDMRVVMQDLLVKIPPDQFRQPDPSACLCRSLFDGGTGRARQFTNRDGTESQVHREIARPLDSREIAGLAVGVDPVAEVVQQELGAGTARRDFQVVQIAGAEPQGGERGHQRRHAIGKRGQRVGVLCRRVGLHEKGLQLFQPGVLVRGEHRVGLAGLCEHLAALEHDMVL